LKKLGVPSDTTELVRDYLRRDRDERRLRSVRDDVTGLRSAAGVDFLLGQVLPDLRQTTEALLAARSDFLAAIEETERTLEAMPDPEAVAVLRTTRDNALAEVLRAQAAFAHADEQLTAVGNVRDRKTRAYERVMDEAATLGLVADDDRRLTEHIDRVRKTLVELRVATTRRHAERISVFVLEALTRLLRKERLITEVTIRPEDCALELFDERGGVVPADQLSAGERQLLAVAILWGLAQAAGQPLPVLIDTPLGRLDSSHRGHLIERYFPQASHQVILLSTDTEIDEAAYENLKAHIGHAYEVVFDPTGNSSSVRAGYFW
jgi:DNA sulfur modification protein DndD